jgi:hypothetical protein
MFVYTEILTFFFSSTTLVQVIHPKAILGFSQMIFKRINMNHTKLSYLRVKLLF